jgi:hypothetical protein
MHTVTAKASALEAHARLITCKDGILSAFVKSGCAQAWDTEFQCAAMGESTRLFPTQQRIEEDVPLLTEDQRALFSEPQFAGAVNDEEGVSREQISAAAALPVPGETRRVHGVALVDPDSAYGEAVSLAAALEEHAPVIGEVDEDALAASCFPARLKRKRTAALRTQPALGGGGPEDGAPAAPRKRGRPKGSKNKKTLERERAAAAAAPAPAPAGAPSGPERA